MDKIIKVERKYWNKVDGLCHCRTATGNNNNNFILFNSRGTMYVRGPSILDQ